MSQSYFRLALLLPFLAVGCTSLPLQQTPNPKALCAKTDWFEVGRNDGALGLSTGKIAEYRVRCDDTPHPVNEELYLNGHNAGLIDYCTATVGLEAGRNGLPYENVCPGNLEKPFIESYRLGLRIRTLEQENVELDSRIDNLNRLIKGSYSDSMKAQVDQLRARRTQIGSQIFSLEQQAQGTF